ncbi:MAG TPA: hypothetical protein PLP87_10350 [Clostridiales bacterium]|nr:hypothetical protein [Clostridiaceae bacterium]HOQ08185.1 hypothetical protein [Clostridiales bacterium]
MGKHDKVLPGLISERDLCKIREAVCIQVEKIYDSCKEKDCIEDARVYFRDPDRMNWLVNNAINVKARRAEVVKVFSDVEEVPFKRGFYTVDIKFFIKVTLDFFVPKRNGGIKIISVPGIVMFDKKVILFGSEGNVKIFKSHYVEHGIDDPGTSALQQDNLPISKVEVAEPITLNAKIVEVLENACDDGHDRSIPATVSELLEDVDFDDTDLLRGEDRSLAIGKRVVATIGLFSIIKLARYVQLLIPAFDFCVPNKQCVAATDEDACGLFDTIEFPIDEFFPPQKADFPGAEEDIRSVADEE